MAELINFLVLFACFAKLGYAADPPYATGVFCQVHKSVMVETDPGRHRYMPFFTRLSQCGGSAGFIEPNIKKCVKKETANVSYRVSLSGLPKEEVITLQQHTSCQTVCVKDKSSCDLRFQTWSVHDCRCDCKYRSEPKPSPCQLPKVWQQSACTCGCPTVPKKCPEKKEWSKEECSCMCTKRYMNRCSRKNKMISQQGCKCIDPPVKYLNNTTAAARQNQAKCTGVEGKIVVMIVILEFLFLLVIFFLVYRCILRHEPELDPSTSSLKRMKYEINKLKSMTIRKKAKDQPPVKEQESLQPNGIQQDSPTLEQNQNVYSQDVGYENSTELSSDRDEPYGFYPDPVYEYDTCETETYQSETGQVTAV